MHSTAFKCQLKTQRNQLTRTDVLRTMRREAAPADILAGCLRAAARLAASILSI